MATNDIILKSRTGVKKYPKTYTKNIIDLQGGSGIKVDKATGSISQMGDVYTDDIMSETMVGGSGVELASFNTTDNHWHIANTKVDDTIYIDGELELGSTGDLGANMISAIHENCGVVANSGESTEEELTDLQVDGVTYGIGGGGATYYLHYIRLGATYPYEIWCKMILPSSNSLTFETFRTQLNKIISYDWYNSNIGTSYFSAVFNLRARDDVETYGVMFIAVNTSHKITSNIQDLTFDSITDTVTQL